MRRINLELPSPKVPGSFDRTVSLENTFSQIPFLRRRFKIDRISDLTLLDRAQFPVVNAIVARSCDEISVYNGKGPTLLHATVGAVMEAVERQAAASIELPTASLQRETDDAIDARELGALTDALDRQVRYVEGYDIAARRPRLVPLAAVQTPWSDPRIFEMTSTNGLASGNTLVEATYHALFELVERHLFSLAQARGHVVPRLLIASLTGSPSGSWVEAMVDDRVARTIYTPTSDATIDHLCDRVERVGLGISLVAYDEPPLPILIVATVSETRPDRERAHLGLGCSWSPRHALLRALTEAMQSRLADTSGSREDIVLANDPLQGSMALGRRASRQPAGRWYFDTTDGAISLDALPDRASGDLAADVCTLLAALQDANIKRVVVVDITPPDCPVHVVRVIAPELETAFVDGRIGPAIAKIIDHYNVIAR